MAKTHQLNEPFSSDWLYFLTVRNPLDTLLSLFALNSKRPSINSIFIAVEKYIDFLKNASEINKRCPTITLRYEEFVEDMEKIFSAIEEKLAISIAQIDKETIKYYLSRENVQQYIEQFSSFGEYDSTHFHGNHITPTGKISESDSDFVRFYARKFLKKHKNTLQKWGYCIEETAPPKSGKKFDKARAAKSNKSRKEKSRRAPRFDEKG